MCIADTRGESEADAVAKWANSSLLYSFLFSLSMHHKPVVLSGPECDSSHASNERMLPVAIAIQESAAP